MQPFRDSSERVSASEEQVAGVPLPLPHLYVLVKGVDVVLAEVSHLRRVGCEGLGRRFHHGTGRLVHATGITVSGQTN